MKRQSFITILLTMLMSMTGAKSFAHDIEATNSDGVTIYYVWTNNNTELAVSYRGSRYGNDYDYIGNLVIPSSVEYNGNTYNVTTIGSYAFYKCKDLTSVTIPNSVTSIGNNAFENCFNLTSVTIPNSVTTIYGYAFHDCRSLTSVTIPNSVTTISGYTFLGCSGLTSVTIPNSVTTIESSAFKYCSGLSSVTIPNSVTTISESAFLGCRELSSVTIPNSVTYIGESAFGRCSSLTSVIIGSGVLSIGGSAFSNTNLKKTIWLTNTPPTGYKNATGTANYVSNDQFGISNQVVYKYLSSNFVVDGIRYVPVSPSDRTCDAIDCTYDASVENINIGETVTNKGVTLTVMKVNPYTCYNNKHIKDLKLGLSGEIGNYAFYGCGNMETAELGQNIPSIGGYAFCNCSKLKSIVIPDAVTSLGANTFQNCSAMTSVKIGNGIETINGYTFADCSSLPTITIPKAVTRLDDFVFWGCTSLAMIIIADSKSTLTLGSNKKDYNDYGYPLFSSCPLDYVYIGRDISYHTSSDYGYSPFYRNTSLRAVKITDKETEISENEFYGCTNLQQVEIGDGVTTIGNWAFSGCSSLKYFAFGSQLITISQNAFSDCAALIEISSKAKTPPECGNQALDDINKWECRLFVPEGCYDIYKSAEQWKEFFFIEEGESSINDIPSYKEMDIQIQCNGSLLTIIGADVGTTIRVFDIEGRPVSTIKASAETTTINTSLQIGDIGIVKIGDKVVKVMMK